MHQRDDIYEYSLDTHHDDEHGKKVRRKIYLVLALLSAVTIIEVIMGLLLEPSTFLTTSFIVLTLVKAGYIVYVFMHLGDEKKNVRAAILFPFIVLIGYLIYIALTESVYVGMHRPSYEAKLPQSNASHHGDEHGAAVHGDGAHSDGAHGEDSHGHGGH